MKPTLTLLTTLLRAPLAALGTLNEHTLRTGQRDVTYYRDKPFSARCYNFSKSHTKTPDRSASPDYKKNAK